MKLSYDAFSKKLDELGVSYENEVSCPRKQNQVCLQNYSRGCCGLTNAINSFELLDKNNNIIEDLIDFVGDFHTGKRIIRFDEYDDFFELHSEKELVRIEGTVVENITTNYGSD